MVIDSGSKIFEFAPGSGVSRSMANVRSTQIAVQLAEHLVAEEPQQPFDPAGGLLRSRLRCGLRLSVKGERVGYRDLRGITRAFGRLGEVLSVEILGERSFSSSTIILAAACALCMFPVADNPDCIV
jgi:hypothetical protein